MNVISSNLYYNNCVRLCVCVSIGWHKITSILRPRSIRLHIKQLRIFNYVLSRMESSTWIYQFVMLHDFYFFFSVDAYVPKLDKKWINFSSFYFACSTYFYSSSSSAVSLLISHHVEIIMIYKFKLEWKKNVVKIERSHGGKLLGIWKHSFGKQQKNKNIYKTLIQKKQQQQHLQYSKEYIYIEEMEKKSNLAVNYDWSVSNFLWTSRLNSNYGKRCWCIANRPPIHLLI